MNGMAKLGLATLDALPMAIAVVDENLRPVMLNRRAELILARAEGLCGGADGQPMAAHSSGETTRLQMLVADTCRDPSGGGGVRLGSDGNGAALLVLVLPLAGRETSPLTVTRPVALLLILDPALAARLRPAEDRLRPSGDTGTPSRLACPLNTRPFGRFSFI